MSFLGEGLEFVDEVRSFVQQGVEFGPLSSFEEGSLRIKGQGSRGGGVVSGVVNDGVEMEDEGRRLSSCRFSRRGSRCVMVRWGWSRSSICLC